MTSFYSFQKSQKNRSQRSWQIQKVQVIHFGLGTGVRDSMVKQCGLRASESPILGSDSPFPYHLPREQGELPHRVQAASTLF